MFRFKRPKMNKQWFLYGILAVSLGFNLSMNPEYFHNFARNEHMAVGTTELASGGDAAAPAAAANTGSWGEFKDSKGVAYEAKIDQLNGHVIATFSSKTEASGAECSVCGIHELKGVNLGDRGQIALALEAIAKGQPTTGAPVAQVSPGKPGELLDADLEKYAEKCKDKKDKELKMECHAQQLAKLSADLADDTKQGSLVYRYFKKYLEGDIKRALESPTAESEQVMAANGMMTTIVKSIDTTALENAKQLSTDIMESLQPTNGQKTIERIMAMNQKAFQQQMINAQELYRSATCYQMNSGCMINPNAANIGRNGLSLGVLMQNYSNQKTAFSNALDGMSTDHEGNLDSQAYLKKFLMSGYSAPVMSLISQVNPSVSNGTNNAGQQVPMNRAQDLLADMVIGPVNWADGNSVVTGEYTPGQNQVVVVPTMQSRQQGIRGLEWQNGAVLPTPSNQYVPNQQQNNGQNPNRQAGGNPRG